MHKTRLGSVKVQDAECLWVSSNILRFTLSWVVGSWKVALGGQTLGPFLVSCWLCEWTLQRDLWMCHKEVTFTFCRAPRRLFYKTSPFTFTQKKKKKVMQVNPNIATMQFKEASEIDSRRGWLKQTSEVKCQQHQISKKISQRLHRDCIHTVCADKDSINTRGSIVPEVTACSCLRAGNGPPSSHLCTPMQGSGTVWLP